MVKPARVAPAASQTGRRAGDDEAAASLGGGTVAVANDEWRPPSRGATWRRKRGEAPSVVVRDAGSGGGVAAGDRTHSAKRKLGHAVPATGRRGSRPVGLHGETIAGARAHANGARDGDESGVVVRCSGGAAGGGRAAAGDDDGDESEIVVQSAASNGRRKRVAIEDVQEPKRRASRAPRRRQRRRLRPRRRRRRT